MSSTVDNRVVEMQFNNRQFETNVRTSMSTLDKLKSSLNLSGAAKSLDGLGNASDKASSKFSVLETIAVGALLSIGAAAAKAGLQLSKSLTIDQMTAGFEKYGQKTQAVQTIIAATGQELEYVNQQMEKLNWFTDETSYNFVDMVGNIGKFTAAGIDLEVATTAMQGIANWAAVSGQGANEASRAMYNLAQSIGMGVVKLQDWKSIENANMATKEFKETAIETAKALGTLKKNSDVTFENFSSTLSKGWFTSDVLLATLDKYGAYSNEIYEIML